MSPLQTDPNYEHRERISLAYATWKACPYELSREMQLEFEQYQRTFPTLLDVTKEEDDQPNN